MMNKFAKTMSNTTYKLKQKTGMAEKTVDQGFEDARNMLNSMMDNANEICKAFVKHAESMEGLAPNKKLDEPYRLSVDHTTEVNLDMQQLFNYIASITVEYGDKKREVVASLQKYIADLQAVKEKVKKRDELLTSYDKHNSKLQGLSSSKHEDKINKERTKVVMYKEQLDATNRDAIDSIHQLHSAQQQNLSPAFHLIVSSQMQFFERMAGAYQGSAVPIM